MQDKPLAEVVPFLSVRGRNLLFLNLLVEALQFDRLTQAPSMREMKRAFTPDAVRKIHQAVELVWSGVESYEKVFGAESDEKSSGIYIGVYEPPVLIRGVTRHSLYSDRILLVDPFHIPSQVNPQYNPVLHPEQHRSTTVKWAWLWLALWPWIEADLLHFIRTPGDFDSGQQLAAMRIAQERYERHAALDLSREKLDDEELGEWFAIQKRQLLLSYGDAYFRQKLKEMHPDIDEAQIERTLAYLQKQRDEDPYYVEPPRDRSSSEILQLSTGTNYEMAKVTAQVTGSHLITDIPLRWEEMRIDRREEEANASDWTPFAKAFHDLPFRFLNNVAFTSALTLREEDRLEDLRTFLRRVWRESREEDPFSKVSAENLGAELHHHIREAEAEWDEIDRDLLKRFGTSVAGGALAMGPAIAVGGAAWVGAAVATASATDLFVTGKKRREFPRRYPAAFFADLRKKVEPR